MIAKIYTVIIAVLLLLVHNESFVTGTFITCSCNLDHSLCVNNTCRSDLRCHRQIYYDYVNHSITRDYQFCPTNGIGDEVQCGISSHHDSVVSFRLCCRGNFCNTNDSAMNEFLNSLLPGDHVSTSTASNPTSTDAPGSKNEGSNENSIVWIIIAVITIIFVTVQIVCVSIALIIGCRKFK